MNAVKTAGTFANALIATKTTTFSNDPTVHSPQCNGIRRGEMEESVVVKRCFYSEVCSERIHNPNSTTRRIIAVPALFRKIKFHPVLQKRHVIQISAQAPAFGQFVLRK